MTTEERLAKVERELGRAKRRSRWLLVALGLTTGAFALAWIFAGAAPALQAQVVTPGAMGRGPETDLLITQSADGKTLYLWTFGPGVVDPLRKPSFRGEVQAR
jgi:hypothetical protein